MSNRWWGDGEPIGPSVVEMMRRAPSGFTFAIPESDLQPVTLNCLSVADYWNVETVEIDGVPHKVYSRKEGAEMSHFTVTPEGATATTKRGFDDPNWARCDECDSGFVVEEPFRRWRCPMCSNQNEAPYGPVPR